MSAIFVIVATFLASAVEMVEALVVVLDAAILGILAPYSAVSLVYVRVLGDRRRAITRAAA
jgi:hypothetical protein